VYLVVEPDGHVTGHREIRSRGETKRAKRKADGGLKRTGTSLKRTDDATAIEASLAENAEGEKAN
jgi:hypothetical protein